MNVLKSKPLQNQALIYDKDCPMCCVYTSAFIKAGVLEPNGRQPYSVNAIESVEWDAERAKNEIALVNFENGKVTYGIDSMFAVISHRFRFLNPLFSWKPFHWVMTKFYSFISYNRKVIAPPAKNTSKITCTPDVNLKYRLLYMVFAVVMAAGVNAYTLGTLNDGAAWPAFGIIAGIIIARLVVQTIVVGIAGEQKQLLDYLGNLVTINLQLAVLVAPIFLVDNGFDALFEALCVYLILVTIYISRTHIKRLKSIEMSPLFCLTWAVQWIFIYLLAIGL